MSDQTPVATATDGYTQLPNDWFPATQVSPFIQDDPGLVWLEYHGAKHGFQPDTSPYEFLDFIGEKGQQFEDKWRREMAPLAEIVCSIPSDVQTADKLHLTFDLMLQGAPVIAHSALWWAPERIYGIPDLLVHTSWLADRFPELLVGMDPPAPAVNLGRSGSQGHYVVMDLKFTTKLDKRSKAKDLEAYTAQVRIYSYMLGQLQGVMPIKAYLITRDRIYNPLTVNIHSLLEEPLDEDLASFRDMFIEIKLNGDQYRPWEDEIVSINITNRDDRWCTAKQKISHDLVPGGDAGLLYQVGQKTKTQLAALGYPNLASMLEANPEDVPFEECKGIGPKKAGQIRAVLAANKMNSPVLPTPELIPAKRPHEFYIDYEYFTNVNVDFDLQWPTLDGKEMVFMIGVGWWDDGTWCFETITAGAEDQASEHELIEQFLLHLDDLSGGAFLDGEQTSLYHWSGAEVWQSQRVADRHQVPEVHALRNLPWVDLQKVFLEGAAAVPGAWDFGLKSVARALGEYDPVYAVQWPGELDEGLQVMVLGWEAYKSATPLDTYEMNAIQEYLETDCKALCKILRWLRRDLN